MAGKVTLTVIRGVPEGKTFSFEEHDTFLCGRLKENHVCLAEDNLVSRHHCILEINPPDVRIRDLGSLNGIYINGERYGGRARKETPEEGAKRTYPTLDLQDGNTIGIGETTLLVSIEMPEPAARRIYCQHCQKDVTAEAGTGQQGPIICSACQRSMQPELEVSSQPDPSPVVEIIPDYQLVRELGKGGMGEVYLVRHIQDGHLAALKFMLPKVAVDESARIRFLREIKTTYELQHRHIVRFISNGIYQGAFYFLLEYCKGGNVYDLMKARGGRLPLHEAGPIMLQALEGLAYAHSQRFIHRDLKPPNILLSGMEGQWSAKIADLGLAKNFEEAGLSGMTVTTRGFAGSLVYMPREQIINFKYIKPVSDVWSIGATYYHLLTGRLPRIKRPGEETINMVLYGEAVPIRQRNPEIPPAVASVIDRALLTDETKRYQDAGEMYQALASAL